MKCIIGKKSTGIYYIKLTEDNIKSILVNGNKRVICTINDRIDFHCAILNSKYRGHYIIINKKLIEKLELKKGQEVEISLRIDDSKYQFNMPEEFRYVLSKDFSANQIFHELTPGNQRGLLYLINNVKSLANREKKSLIIADHIKNGITRPKDINFNQSYY